MFSGEQEANGSHLVIRLCGELDISATGSLRELLMPAIAHSPLVTVDLSRVKFLDCAAYGVFIAIRNRARSKGGDLLLTGAKGSPRRLLRVVGYDPAQEMARKLERLS